MKHEEKIKWLEEKSNYIFDKIQEQEIIESERRTCLAEKEILEHLRQDDKIINEIIDDYKKSSQKEKINTPTLEEVREHFKDAKIIEPCNSTERFEIIHNTIEFDDDDLDYFCMTTDRCNVSIWLAEHGYAEIIEYKKPETEFPQDMKVWDNEKHLAETREVLGIYKGQYMVEDGDAKVIGYKNAEPITKDVSEWTADDINTINDVINYAHYRLCHFDKQANRETLDKARKIFFNHSKTK